MTDTDSFRATKLDNGVRVVSERLPHVRTASVGVWVDAGARHELPKENGVAHMLEHMAFKGTERRNAQRIAEEIEDVGGHLNAYTSREHTAYYARVLSTDVRLAGDIIADILQHSLFDEGELARERGVVLQEIGQVQDTPDDLIFDIFQECAYPDQALGRSVLGPLEVVSAMRRDSLLGFMAKFYNAENLVVAGAGEVEHEMLVELAGTFLGNLRAESGSGPEPGIYRGGLRLVDRDLDQVHVILGLEAMSLHDSDYFALQIFSTMLGGGMSSRLFQEIREKRGLAYSVFSFTSCFRETGMLGVYAGTNEADLPDLVPLLCDVSVGLASSVTESELNRARNQLKASLMMSLESCSSVCEDLARHELIFGRRIELDEIIERIDSVAQADIRRVGARLFGMPRPTAVAVGRHGHLLDYDQIRKNLTQ